MDVALFRQANLGRSRRLVAHEPRYPHEPFYLRGTSGGHLSDRRRFGCPSALGYSENKHLERLVRRCGSDVDHVGTAAGL